MVFKRHFTISILIILCFLSSFFALFNGFYAIVEAENNMKKEIRYGYQNEVIMYINSIETMDISDLLGMAHEIDTCNIYIEDLRIHFEECDYLYCPQVLLCQNEKLPYPTKNGAGKIPQNGILISDNIVHDGDGQLSTHEYTFKICDEIDTEKYIGLSNLFVLNAEDYFRAFEDEKISNNIVLRFCSNKVDLYNTYQSFKDMIQEKYPYSHIFYEEGERNSSIFTGLFSGKTLLGVLLYLFALINVMIISFYWVNARKREVGIRKAYGATNQEIIILLLKEILIIIAVSAIIAFLIQTMIQIFVRNGFEFSEWMRVALFYLGTIVITALVSILVPVRYILKIHPAEGIKL